MVNSTFWSSLESKNFGLFSFNFQRSLTSPMLYEWDLVTSSKSQSPSSPHSYCSALGFRPGTTEDKTKCGVDYNNAQRYYYQDISFLLD